MPVDDPERFNIPTAGRSPLEMFRAMRAYFEKVVEAKGGKLDPAWYDDGPEAMPWLHQKQGGEPRGDR
jgi:hypothetical protein